MFCSNSSFFAEMFKIFCLLHSLRIPSILLTPFTDGCVALLQYRLEGTSTLLSSSIVIVSVRFLLRFPSLSRYDDSAVAVDVSVVHVVDVAGRSLIPSFDAKSRTCRCLHGNCSCKKAVKLLLPIANKPSTSFGRVKSIMGSLSRKIFSRVKSSNPLIVSTLLRTSSNLVIISPQSLAHLSCSLRCFLSSLRARSESRTPRTSRTCPPQIHVRVLGFRIGENLKRGQRGHV